MKAFIILLKISFIFAATEEFNWVGVGPLKQAVLLVPLNHSDPNSELIPIPLSKYSVGKQPSKKIVIVNPGGPGKSGTEMVKQNGKQLAEMFDNRMDIIGFDSRGTDRNAYVSPLKCMGLFQKGTYASNARTFGASFLPKHPSVAQIEYLDASSQLSANLCKMHSREFLSFTSTVHVARDMDLLRQKLGMDKMNFFGLSYGSVLGMTYSNMFPDNVGHMILDGISNPEHYTGDIFHLRDAHASLVAITNLCDKSEFCELKKQGMSLFMKGRKSLDAITNIISELRTKPKIFEDSQEPGVLTAEMVEQLLFSSIYSPSKWEKVAEAFALAENGLSKRLYEYSVLVKNSDLFGNTKLMAIFCADNDDSRKYSIDEWMDKIFELEKELSFPVRIWGSHFLPCRHWYRAEEHERYVGPWNKSLAYPILMISNVYDPSTPYKSAKDALNLMNTDRKNAVLLTQKSIGHTTFSRTSKCTREFMKNYMLFGSLPPENAECHPDTPLFRLNVEIDTIQDFISE